MSTQLLFDFDKNYNKTDVVREIIQTVTQYMDVNTHIMGEEIYIGDLQKEVGKKLMIVIEPNHYVK